MSRQGAGSSSRPKSTVGAATNPISAMPVTAPRRSAGAVPGIARAASNLRQLSSSPTNTTGPLTSLPAHLRNLSAPRIPSPLGKGTPGQQTRQSFPLRSSKTTQRHVLLPEDAQLAPLPRSPSDANLSSSGRPRSLSASSAGPSVAMPGRGVSPYHHDERNEAEKMNKRELEEAGLSRLTAYSTAEGYRLKLLQAFLKREHGVAVVRVFDDCVYAVYHLPLLPGYGASTKIRSSPAVKSPGGVSMLERMTHAEEVGYDDEYFPIVQQDEPGPAPHDPSEYILSQSPPSPVPMMDSMESVMEHRLSELQEHMSDHVNVVDLSDRSEQSVDRDHYNHEEQQHERERERRAREDDRHREEDGGETRLSETHPTYVEEISTVAVDNSGGDTSSPRKRRPSPPHHHRRRRSRSTSQNIAEAVFFSYGVSVFFGFQASEERTIMADCEAAGVWQHSADEEDWEVDEFHYVYDADADSPRIYNDMFTFKSRNHLFKLSLAHAIAQSTKLSIYEANMQESLELTASLPKELAMTGHLQLDRIQALKMTGRLFRLRMDVNLIGGVLDTPELFWSEASLYPLYEAINQYLEIGPRVQVLNDRLAVVGDLLEIIHDYIDQRSMHRITWIVIILIGVAIIVACGEIVARLVFHSIARGGDEGGAQALLAIAGK